MEDAAGAQNGSWRVVAHVLGEWVAVAGPFDSWASGARALAGLRSPLEPTVARVVAAGPA